MIEGTLPSAENIKACCADLYGGDWARLLLGDSFHPGGQALTERLGGLLDLGPGDRVLDVAAGNGASAVFLAQRFGCAVVGVDYSRDALRAARERAAGAGVADRVVFATGDAEHLPVPDASFDAVICECALCTFPDKATAARELARILRPGGGVGLSDLTRAGPLSDELQTLLGRIACLADARPIEEYVGYLRAAGFAAPHVETHDAALVALVREIRGRLLGAELLAKLAKAPLPLGDVEQAKRVARAAAVAVEARQFGYALLVARVAG